MIHKLKIFPIYFEAHIRGDKPFEIRTNDRNFSEGDTLILQEWRPFAGTDEGQYTGRELERGVSYISDFSQKEGVSVLGLKSPDAGSVQKVELPEVLFHSQVIYSKLTDRALRRTSRENVSDTLEAVARKLREGTTTDPFTQIEPDSISISQAQMTGKIVDFLDGKEVPGDSIELLRSFGLFLFGAKK